MAVSQLQTMMLSQKRLRLSRERQLPVIPHLRGWVSENVTMLAKQPAMPISLPKLTGYRAGRDRRMRAIATALATLTALIAILITSIGYVMTTLI